MAKRGIQGSAVALAAAGLYLAYVGLKDIPFFDGMRSLLRQETPTPKATHSPFVVAGASSLVNAGLNNLNAAKGDTGIAQLTGNAKNAYPAIRAVAPGQILGWGLRDNISDHPAGLAMDVMTRDNTRAMQIIAVFRTLPGAKYWIWNGKIANRDVNNWEIRSRNKGSNDHVDHVHLSFS